VYSGNSVKRLSVIGVCNNDTSLEQWCYHLLIDYCVDAY